MFSRSWLVLLVISAAVAQSVADSDIKSASAEPKIDAVVRAFKDECVEHSDSGACIKGKVLNLLDDALRKDSSKVKHSNNFEKCNFVGSIL